MRKYAFVALIILMASVFGGCGSSDGTSSTVVAPTDTSFESSADVSGKTLYSTSPVSNLAIAYTFSVNNTVTWGNPVINGTWAFNPVNKAIELTPTGATTPTIVLKRNQTETDYYFVYDTNNSNKLFRLYFDQAIAQAYLDSIFKSATTFLMGGTIQWLAGSNPNIDFSTKAVSTFAGSDLSTPANSNDGLKLLARFNHPTGITTDGKGNIYVTDTENHTIRMIDSTGNVATIAGVAGSAGSEDNLTNGTLARFSSPQGITSDGSFLYITDTGNAIIRKYNLTTTEVTTLAGIRGSLGAVDGSGSGAQFYTPVGITTDGTNLYVTDVSYNTIRKIQIATLANSSYSKSVTTLAGTPGTAGFTDAADFAGSSARFSQPVRITTDGSNLYVTDFKNHTIRKIVIATGNTSTLSMYTLSANFSPSGITTDGTNLYVTEVNTTKDNATYLNIIRKIVISTNDVFTIAGGSSSDLNSLDASSALLARFSGSPDIVSMGTSLFATNYSDNKQISTNPSFNNIRQIGP